MKALPLDQIGFGWQDHKSALGWLWLFYCRPRIVHEDINKLPRLAAVKAGFILYGHALPYVILACAAGRLFLFGGLGLDAISSHPDLFYHITKIAVGIAFGIAVGIGVGIAFGIAGGIAGGIAFGIAGGIAGGIARGIAVGIAFGIAVGIAFGIAVPRLYYYPIHVMLTWPRPRTRWFRHHPAIWEEMCGARYLGLHRLLVSYAEEARWKGRYHIEYLIAHYPAQRLEALKAKTILLARRMGRMGDLAELGRLAGRLPEGDKDFLAQTEAVREQVEEISRQQMRLGAINRPVFREPAAELLAEKIISFRERINGHWEPLRTEFRNAAAEWLRIAQRQLDEARRVTTKQLTVQVFRAGDPVDRDQEAFAPRYGVIGELEQQVMMSQGCPGIVLYARRRMGKSTILRNLTGFLPTEVITVFVSMQNPGLFTSIASFAETLSAAIRERIPLEAGAVTDLRGLYEFLGRCNAHLEGERKRLILAVDEYETIDKKIGEAVFPLDLLDAVRESIQTHRRITWIFAGSHEITELEHAPWTSYLVSARTIEVPAFTPAETRLLLTEPLKHSTIWPPDSPKRPRFDAAFWGDGGIDRIHAEAGGWPHLVQLLAETAVDLVNEEEAAALNSDLLDRAIEKSLVRGHNVFYELLHRESMLPGEWDYLLAFRQRENQSPPADERIARSLRRRTLVAEENGAWRLRVPLMARWLKARG
ncbi:MAG: AAA family ATPase [Blastocatellia bacterium]